MSETCDDEPIKVGKVYHILLPGKEYLVTLQVVELTDWTVLLIEPALAGDPSCEKFQTRFALDRVRFIEEVTPK